MFFGALSILVSEKSNKYSYKPKNSECNFALSSNHTLKRMDTGYDKIIWHGFVDHTLDVTWEKASQGVQFCVTLDGKTVAEGSKGETDGDIDLWNVDKHHSNVTEALQKWDRLIKSVDAMTTHLDVSTLPHRQLLLRQMYTNMTNNIRRLHCWSRGEFFLNKCIAAMQANNPNNTIHYQRVCGDIHVKSADCRNATKHGLEVNLDLLLILTYRFVNVANNPFTFLLHPPCELQDFMDLAAEENSMYIKQHTPEWHKCHDSTHVTGSTLRKAIGLDTLKEQKNY